MYEGQNPPQPDQNEGQPKQKTVVEQAQETINDIPSLADINQHGEQVIRSAQNHPELRDQIGVMLQGRRESLISASYYSVVDKVEQADIQALNGELSVDSIRQGFVEAGMTEDEAQQKAQEMQYWYDKRRKELEEEQS